MDDNTQQENLSNEGINSPLVSRDINSNVTSERNKFIYIILNVLTSVYLIGFIFTVIPSFFAPLVAPNGAHSQYILLFVVSIMFMPWFFVVGAVSASRFSKNNNPIGMWWFLITLPLLDLFLIIICFLFGVAHGIIR